MVSGAAPDVLPGTVAAAPPAVLSPPTAMALPVAVTGAGGGEVSWLPPPAEPEPVVVEPDDPDEPAAAGAAPLDEPPLDDLPSTATELPVALTGAAAGKASWLPPPAEPEPVVEPDDPDEPAAAGAAAAELDEPLLDDLPSTATELPVALTGAVAGEVSWLPPPAEPEPVVVEPDDPDEPAAAGAAPATNHCSTTCQAPQRSCPSPSRVPSPAR